MRIQDVDSSGLLTLPVAGISVKGTLDRGKDFAGQPGETYARHPARIRPRLERARTG